MSPPFARVRPTRRPLSVAGAALAVVALILGTVPGAAAQFAPTGNPSITVTGTGRSSAPAETARFQFSVGRGDPFSGGFGGGFAEPAMMEDTGDAVAATPEAGDIDAALEPPDGPTGFDLGPPPPSPLTEDDLEPVIQAMVEAGVERDDIAVNVSPGSAGGGPYGLPGGLIEAAIAEPDADEVADLVAAATAAATEAGFVVQHAGVEYDLADCSALIREARQAAIDDARAQAEELAELLEVTLGDPILVADYGFFGTPAVDDDGCPSAPSNISYGPFEIIDTPAFDPNAEAEAEAYATLNIAFAYETPAA